MHLDGLLQGHATQIQKCSQPNKIINLKAIDVEYAEMGDISVDASASKKMRTSAYKDLHQDNGLHGGLDQDIRRRAQMHIQVSLFQSLSKTDRRKIDSLLKSGVMQVSLSSTRYTVVRNTK